MLLSCPMLMLISCIFVSAAKKGLINIYYPLFILILFSLVSPGMLATVFPFIVDKTWSALRVGVVA